MKIGKKSLTLFELLPFFDMFSNFSLYFDFEILVISHFGFEGWSWVLIASVPDLCILFPFNFKPMLC